MRTAFDISGTMQIRYTSYVRRLCRVELVKKFPARGLTVDEYVCSSNKLEFDDVFVENVIIQADKSKVHHVTSSFCKEPSLRRKIWACNNIQGSVCNGDSVNLGTYDYFTPDGPQTALPANVSVRVGRNTDLKYLVIQSHFRNISKGVENEAVAQLTLLTTDKTPRLLYQSYMLTSKGYIPANKENGFFSEVACPWHLPPVYAFRYFVHTHQHGYFVEGFLVRNGTWTLIGSQLSRQKQTDFLRIPGSPLLIQPGDSLVSRCFYLNPSSERIPFGLGHQNEMCSFDIDFGYDPKFQDSFRVPRACVTSVQSFSLCNHREVNGLCV